MALYDKLVSPADTSDMPDDVARDVPANGMKFIAANGLQNAGDQVINPKTVLPWLLTAQGAPGLAIALLVPIRESLSMLPQAALTPWVKRRAHRKSVWILGSITQGVMALIMALSAAVFDGMAAAVAILAALAIFALGRSLCSIGSKDVQGRTIPKGQRGQITGLATVLSGVVAITLGLGIRWFGGDDLPTSVLTWMIAISALTWFAGAVVFHRVTEPAGETSEDSAGSWVKESWELLSDDAPFRNFVIVRSLLLVSALSPAFFVSLSAERGDGELSGLGPFLIASGAAAILGGQVSGKLSDKSSKSTMTWGAGLASVILLAVMAQVTFAEDWSGWALPVAYFLITLTHTGVRVARKTYVVDMAEGDQRTTYVAVANSAMGVILLATGAISGGLAMLGTMWALGFFAVLGLIGVAMARALPDVSAKG
ncbi:MFS transporter [Corynebacterium xerosis]|uniref:MFS transporter n=1 Tax=Corynebacterium xerosis TaxID=1725 RepID=UPI000628168B|nr:MFS transporter [Corynebacterium xerosis]KKO81711.1 MFS transporter [Corynebacterium xerosis]SQB95180.1 Major Facilitator Superfamily [Clostridium paraputrificum]